MRPRDVLGVLAKASPYVLKILRKSNATDRLDAVKTYSSITAKIKNCLNDQLRLMNFGPVQFIFKLSPFIGYKPGTPTGCTNISHHKAHFNLDESKKNALKCEKIKNTVVADKVCMIFVPIVGVDSALLHYHPGALLNLRAKEFYRSFMLARPTGIR